MTGLAIFGEPPEEVEDDTGRRFIITNDRQAAWVAQKFFAANAALTELADRRAQYQADLDAWYDAEKAGPEGDRQKWRALLERYALDRREATGEKSWKLPGAEFRTTHTDLYPKVADEKVVLAWLAGLPEADREKATKRSVVASGFKQLVTVELWYLGCRPGCCDPGEVLRFPSPVRAQQIPCNEHGMVDPVEWLDPVWVTVRDGLPVPGATIEPEKTTVAVTPAGGTWIKNH